MDGMLRADRRLVLSTGALASGHVARCPAEAGATVATVAGARSRYRAAGVLA